MHVEVWRVLLDREAGEALTLARVLNDEEHARARRFHSPQLQARWTVARAALRIVLARALGCDPAAIAFAIDKRGKPALHLPYPGLAFSLSHSEGIALIALAEPARLGVDVEFRRPNSDLLEIARRYFKTDESVALAAMNDEHRTTAFYRIWTRKEAVLKALGVGVTESLDRCRVTGSADALLLQLDGEDAARWSLLDIELPDAAAAVAIDQPNAEQRMRDFASIVAG